MANAAVTKSYSLVFYTWGAWWSSSSRPEPEIQVEMGLKRNSSYFFDTLWCDLLTGSDTDAWALAEVSHPVVRDAQVHRSLSERDKQQQMWPVNKTHFEPQHGISIRFPQQDTSSLV